jgi:hypothetical protein
MSDLDLDPGEIDRMPKRSRIDEAVATGPVVVKRATVSNAGSEKVPCACQFCANPISCSTQVNGTINKGPLRAHEKRCPKNPNRLVVSVAGKKVSAVFGSLESDAEFRVPEAVRLLTQGSRGVLAGAIHVFPDGSQHPVVGHRTGEPIPITTFFSSGTRCCSPEDKSMMQFRLRPDMFPNMYDDNGQCVISEIGTKIIVGAPETSKPWTTSQLRLISLNYAGTVEVFDIRK